MALFLFIRPLSKQENILNIIQCDLSGDNFLRNRHRTKKTCVSLCVLVVALIINMSKKQISHSCELGGKCHALLDCNCVTSVPIDNSPSSGLFF